MHAVQLDTDTEPFVALLQLITEWAVASIDH